MNEIGFKKSELDTPALWVDLTILEQNIRHLSDFFKSAGVNWRPHTKGIKTPAIAHKAIAAGAIGVTCAKLGEAEVMAAAGITDILIANEVVGSQKITRLVNLRRHADVKVAVDDPENARAIGQAAQAKGVEVGILVDVDTGMGRTGVQPGEAAVDLSMLVHQTPGLRYQGVMAWEGHAAGMSDREAKQRTIEEAVGALDRTAQMCRQVDLPVEIVSGGGSGTYLTTAHLPGITEIQAGGAIFCDATYLQWGVDTTPSLFVQARVISRPAPDLAIFDAGFKALPAWGERNPIPVDLSGFKAFRTSAEHGSLLLEGPNETLKVGQTVDFIVGYGDQTVFLYDQLYGVRDGVVETVWTIQGRGKVR